MKPPQNEHLIPVVILDLAKSIYEAKNQNYKNSLIYRLEEINKFCTEVLTDLNKKK